MEKKSKFDYEIDNFRSVFEKDKEKKIVLYGTGRMTATLVNGIKDFRIIGLCDRDSSLIGTTMYGIPVLDRGTVEEKADMVIINTSATYWETIYQRIQDWRVPIYYLNGELAEYKEEKLTDDPYWNKNSSELKTLISQNEVISFDIFDTLVMRKVLFPYDVFRIVEIQINSISGEKIPFAEIRKKASSMLNNPTLDDIYRLIKKLTNRTDNEIDNWKNIEVQTEKNVIIARQDMVDLCVETMKNKQVFLISDMYYSKEVLQELLQGIGLCIKQEQILVSCEQKKTKEDGSLWKYYKENVVCGRKAIHIGDSKKADIQNAQIYGIKAYHVRSPYEMLQSSLIKTILPTIESIYSSLTMGVICGRLFNSPFAMNPTQGKIRFKDEKEAGYCLLGSLIYSFMEWLSDKAIKDGIEQLVFFARDGYLMLPIYNYMKEIKKKEGIPEAVYLEISRRAVWNASIYEEEDIYKVADFPYIGNFKQFLEDRFGIFGEEDSVASISIDSKAILKKELYSYKDKILKRSQEERKNYLNYFESCNINDDFAVVDSQFYGSTQYYLGKLLGKRLKGYYLCACTSSNNQYLDRNEMYGCFQGKEGRPENTNVRKQAQFLEAFFTAPNGMLEYIRDDGSKKYTEDMLNQTNFGVRWDMIEGIKEFINEMITIQRKGRMNENDLAWADKFFGCMLDGQICRESVSDKIKKAFYFDNQIVSKRESPIWE